MSRNPQTTSSAPAECRDPTLEGLVRRLRERIKGIADSHDSESRLALYREAFPHLEQALWCGRLDPAAVASYQRAFREYEEVLARQDRDGRHGFVVVIPVADRPKHLGRCLASILHLCECFLYGGFRAPFYRKVRVIVADDSRRPESISRHQALCRRFSSQGLRTEYFGAEEQIRQLGLLEEEQRRSLRRILGETEVLDPVAYGHKGASVTRNLVYLRLQQLLQGQGPTLVQFIDSDQSFCVNVPDTGGSRSVYAINYFHHLDEIFRHTDARLLTGKVVGDPPVSAAVMASNFQDDVIHFLTEQASLNPEQDCQFHRPAGAVGDAAYHDMADLFGFHRQATSHRYHCSLDGRHDNGACFVDFASRLHLFFFGSHPTRETYFHHQGPLSRTLPARTVYTGNYVFRPECLRYFIPFATLKLRMAGPVLGRLLRAELGDRFVTANLPMLHRRILGDTGEAEFRPDVIEAGGTIDLSGEFERQYFGDVMLFAVERLIEDGFPALTPASAAVMSALEETERELNRQYRQKHEQILTKLRLLRNVLSEESRWWHRDARFAPALDDLRGFAAAIAHNFGEDSRAWRSVNSRRRRRERLDEIERAILDYAGDRAAWCTALR